jgi:hypothetical protein
MTKGLELDRAALVPLICERLAKGEPLAVICRSMSIGRSTVNLWRREDGNIDALIQDARDDGFDVLAAECLGIADDTLNDYAIDVDGAPILKADHIQRSRLRVDTRLKLLSKWDPKRYGDKASIEHTGPGGKDLSISVTFHGGDEH